MLKFKPISRLEIENEAAERWEARCRSLETFSLETVDAARRLQSRPAAGKRQLSEEALFTLDDYENFQNSTSLEDYREQIKTATGASNPSYEWAKLDKKYNKVTPVGRLANNDGTFIFVLDSATPDSPHVRVILAPAAALHEKDELVKIIAENSGKQPKERKKVSVNWQAQATQKKKKSRTH